MAIRKTKDEVVYQVVVNTFLALVLIAVLVPLWRVLVSSFVPYIIPNEPTYGLAIPPWEWNLTAYGQLTSHPVFFRAALNSFILLFGGVAFALFMTVPLAYFLSVKAVPGRRLLSILVIIPFLFNPGLIPSFLLVDRVLNLHNNLLAIIVPAAFNIYNIFVMKNFFEALPDDLKEAARIDGASEMYVLFRIILPLSLPIVLTIGLFYGVHYWNEFFNPILYIDDAKLKPLPVLLREILLGMNLTEGIQVESGETMATVQSLKSASVMLTTIPMLIVYPWIQKYFTKGTLAGGVKG